MNDKYKKCIWLSQHISFQHNCINDDGISFYALQVFNQCDTVYVEINLTDRDIDKICEFVVRTRK